LRSTAEAIASALHAQPRRNRRLEHCPDIILVLGHSAAHYARPSFGLTSSILSRSEDCFREPRPRLHRAEIGLDGSEMSLHAAEMHLRNPEMRLRDARPSLHDPEMPFRQFKIDLRGAEMPLRHPRFNPVAAETAFYNAKVDFPSKRKTVGIARASANSTVDASNIMTSRERMRLNIQSSPLKALSRIEGRSASSSAAVSACRRFIFQCFSCYDSHAWQMYSIFLRALIQVSESIS
jgi:hypothetical protein